MAFQVDTSFTWVTGIKAQWKMRFTRRPALPPRVNNGEEASKELEKVAMAGGPRGALEEENCDSGALAGPALLPPLPGLEMIPAPFIGLFVIGQFRQGRNQHKSNWKALSRLTLPAGCGWANSPPLKTGTWR